MEHPEHPEHPEQLAHLEQSVHPEQLVHPERVEQRQIVPRSPLGHHPGLSAPVVYPNLVRLVHQARLGRQANLARPDP